MREIVYLNSEKHLAGEGRDCTHSSVTCSAPRATRRDNRNRNQRRQRCARHITSPELNCYMNEPLTSSCIVLDEAKILDAIQVGIRLMFLQIGKALGNRKAPSHPLFPGAIETQLERFIADVAIEARWLADSSFLANLSENDRSMLSTGHTVRLPDYRNDETHWYPRLFIMNTTMDPDAQHIRYSLRRDRLNGLVYLREHRLCKGGVFFSPFDFHHFPHDIQELSICIGSSESGTKIKLESDAHIPSGINREAFVALQEWILYEHVEARTRLVKGFAFQTDEDGELDTPGHEKERRILTISCHAGRTQQTCPYQ